MKEERYIVVTEKEKALLEVKVNQFIDMGYMPLGGVSIACDENDYYFAQAMIRKED